jgi:hypothetical protein
VKNLLASVLCATILLGSTAALADDASAPPDAPRAETSTWYGYQTLATDGVALALLVPALTSGSSATQQGFGMGAGLMFGVGAPLVHFSHGQVGKGFADLGVRVGATLGFGALGALIGRAAYQPPANPACTTTSTSPAATALEPAVCDAVAGVVGPLAATAAGLEIGAMVGAASASAFDALFLAREHVRDDTAAAAPAPRAARVEPTLAVAPEGSGARATLGVLGTF